MKSIIFALTLLASPISAQTNCGSHEAVVERLQSGFGETLQVIASNATLDVVEVFANLDTGTWTIAVTRSGGATCVVAAGNRYQAVPQGEAT